MNGPVSLVHRKFRRWGETGMFPGKGGRCGGGAVLRWRAGPRIVALRRRAGRGADGARPGA
ncbi:hypothetical protein SY2F82_60230 [Streptomyces sp. Y2F8-2]|nr:hypothetical protein SY2F82_60230 [Streptomyces sp. Y2F8-2]